MSMFDYMLMEGQQAEEYKARKAAEAEKKEKEDYEHYKKRYKGNIESDPANMTGSKYTKHYYANGNSSDDSSNISRKYSDDIKRSERASNFVFSDLDRRGGLEYLKRNRGLDPKKVEKEMEKVADTGVVNKRAINTMRKTGIMQDIDAVNRHMRRHPDKYKESCGIFESVRFLNE